MKVKCIDRRGWACITEGKIYDILKESKRYFTIYNDNGIAYWYSKVCFQIHDMPYVEYYTTILLPKKSTNLFIIKKHTTIIYPILEFKNIKE